MVQDVKYGFRMFWNKPSFTLIAVLSLALGIGANTAIFSLLDSLMFKSLPVQQPDRLVLFGNGKNMGVTDQFPNESWDLFSYPFYRQVQQRTNEFSGVASLLSIPWDVHGFVNNGSSDIEQFQVQLVSGTYFPVLGVNAYLGRVLNDGDDQTAGASPVAVISYAWWTQRLGQNRNVVGKTITIDDIAYTIVGVAPRDFFGTTVGQAPDMWVPLSMEKQMPPMHWDGRDADDFQSLFLIGRLKDGVTPAQASATVNLLFKQHLQARAGSQPAADRLQSIENASVELTPMQRGLSTLRDEFSVSLKVLMGVVALVLLIASANVANLLLAQGAARQKEFAVRLAVGAGRLRLARQLFTESALLALIGGFIGVVLSWWGSRLLLLMASSGPEALPLDVTPNLRVLAFTLGVSMVCAIVFGTAPALRATRIEPNTSLKGGKIGLTTMRNPLGKTFVVGQVALSLLLLVAAGLFVRTLINLQSIPSGFNQENVLLLQVDTSATGLKPDDPKFAAMLRETEEKVKAVPGVQAASFASTIFSQGFWTSRAFTRDTGGPDGQDLTVRNNVVGPDFFAAMGLPLLLGRGFGPQDTANSQRVAVISESMANQFFPNGSPLGKRFGIDGPESSDQMEVIGVVKDAKYGTLTEEFRPMAFYLHVQQPDALGNFVVRLSRPPGTVVPQIRQAFKQVNRNLPIDDVLTLSDQIGRSLVQQKLVARLAAFFGGLALLLASVGLYGVMSYGVARRTSEIGIRMALGAHRRNVLWLVLREALMLVVIGLVIGVLASLALTKTAASLLYELKPNDPLTIAMATLLLAGVAALAGYLPARRAARVDPMVALRDE